jgi:hypothetical protein
MLHDETLSRCLLSLLTSMISDVAIAAVVPVATSTAVQL